MMANSSSAQEQSNADNNNADEYDYLLEEASTKMGELMQQSKKKMSLATLLSRMNLKEQEVQNVYVMGSR